MTASRVLARLMCRLGRHDPWCRGRLDHDPRTGAPRRTVLTFCVLCNGTGSFPDDDHTCGQCLGIGEVVSIPIEIRRRAR